MKSVFFSMLLALLILFLAISAVAGLGMMVVDFYTGGGKMMQGFEVFTLGAILFFVCSTAYIVTKILASTEVIVDTLTKFVEHEISKTKINPLQSLFGGLGSMAFPGQTTIKIGSIDEDGNITPLDETKFSSKDDFIKYRNSILSEAFGQKPADIKKKLEDMTIEELKEEEKKAVDKQNFELAAAIINIIEEKKKKN